MTVIYGTCLENDNIFPCFFHFFKKVDFSDCEWVKAGVILETEGSIRKIQKGHFFTTKTLKRAPLI